MDVARLETLGRAMFGTYWQSEVGVLVGKSSRVVRFWLSGARTIPAADAERIEAMARERWVRLREAIDG
jgi:hypothetical protein